MHFLTNSSIKLHSIFVKSSSGILIVLGLEMAWVTQIVEHCVL